MSITIHRNIELEGASGQPVLLDLYHPAHETQLPTVVFVHGFKGFKDWGGWELVAQHFAHAGFAFIKFNLSHNGVTCHNLTYHTDLEAFGHNNYTKELTDIDSVLNWVCRGIESLPAEICDPERIALIGHSRGGGISIIKAFHDKRIKALITWAAVSELDYAWKAPGFIDEWRKEGVYYALNHRTEQRLPLYYPFFQDFIAHESAYDTSIAMQEMDIPVLILHGTADASIHHDAAHRLHGWRPSAEMKLIPGADHSFGMSHPYTQPVLPAHTIDLLTFTLNFLKRIFPEG